MILNLIIINAAIWVIDVLYRPGPDRLPGHLSRLLAVDSQTLWQPWLWWQFLTYGFAHDSQTIMHVAGNMLGLFFLGQPVEDLYGRKSFLRIYLTSLVLCSVVWCLTQNLVYSGDQRAFLIGASGAVTTVVILFALNFPRRMILFMMFIPMPAWVLGVLLVVMNLMGTLGGAGDAESHRVAFDVHLVGAAYGLVFFRTRWDVGTFWPGNWSSWLAQRRRRPRLKVHDPSEGSSALEKQADAVLAKLHQHGEASLTARERRILEDYSRRMQQKHR
jgi:membrane associated rhomboid family serine protease